MLIPEIMTNKISIFFYDKTVNIMSNTITVDAEGGINYKGLNVADSFKGNVSFSNCAKIQEEYGLDYLINIAITTHPDVNININDIIQYDNVLYNVKDVLKFDSHKMVVGVKWQQ